MGESAECDENAVENKSDVDSDEENFLFRGKSKLKHRSRIIDDESDDEKVTEKQDEPMSIGANLDIEINNESLTTYQQSDSSDDDENCNETKNEVENETEEVENYEVPSHNSDNQDQMKKLHQQSDLFDAEGSSDEDKGEKPDNKNSTKNTPSSVLPKKTSSRRKTAKTHETTRKQKLQLMEIHTESQRLVRESRVSLPYHHPQQRTLEYFLNRKKNVPSRLKPLRNELIDFEANTLIKKELQSVLAVQTAEMKEIRSIGNEEKDCNSLNPQTSVDDSEKLEETGDEHREKKDSDSSFSRKTNNQSHHNHNSESGQLHVKNADDSSINEIVPKMETVKNHKLISAEGPSNISKTITSLNIEALKSFTPRLSGEPSSIIYLEDIPDKSRGTKNHVEDFKQRVLKLITPPTKSKSGAHTLELTIIKKEMDSSGNERLIPEKLTLYTGLPASSKTGLKWQTLKQALYAKIAEKRERERQKRVEIYAIDNEEGFNEHCEQEIDGQEEEEEAEMTDATDTEEEEELMEDDVIIKKKNVRRNVFIDDEAEDEVEDSVEKEEDEADDSGEEDISGESDADDSALTSIKPKPFLFERRGTIELFPAENESQKCNPGKENLNLKLLAEYDFESKNSTAPEQGSENEFPASNIRYSFGSSMAIDDTDTDVRLSFSKSNQFQTPPSRTAVFPAEMKQSEPLIDKISQQQSEELDYSFHLTQLDDDLSSPVILSQQRPALFTPKGKSDTLSPDMDEILSLCSGKFADSLIDTEKSQPTQSVDSQSVSQNMNELMGLCSGGFGTLIVKEDSMAMSDKEKKCFTPFKVEDNSNSNWSTVGSAKRKRVQQIDEDTESDCEDSCVGENDDDDAQTGFESFPNSNNNRKRLAEFLDEEAELSGSEASSDEEEIPEEEDIMEVEEGDAELMPDDDKLRDQIGRAHFKAMLDEDKRELRLMQEKYLPDGDLHSEGKGRQRKFRWQFINDNSQEVPNNDGSDNEDEDDIVEEDPAWRIQRCEREKWLSERPEQEEDYYVSVRKRLRYTDVRERMKNNTNDQNAASVTTTALVPDPPNYEKPQFYRGSFLAKSQHVLDRLAVMTKNSTINPNGAKNSRKFLFSIVSPGKNNNKKVDETSASVKKKAKMEPKRLSQEFDRGSIFRFL